jgi:hypothetical protein
MPRKKTTPTPPAIPQSNYWVRFLESMNVVGNISEELELAPATTAPQVAEPVVISPDQWTFIYRVAERLTPLDGLDRDGRGRAMIVRKQIQSELEAVFQEKTDIRAWFTKTRQNFTMQEHELIEIMYEALEGLKSEQAKELKQQLQGVYSQLVRMRTIGPMG